MITLTGSKGETDTFVRMPQGFYVPMEVMTEAHWALAREAELKRRIEGKE